MTTCLYDLIKKKLDVFRACCTAHEITYVPDHVDKDGQPRGAAIYLDFMQTQKDLLGKDCPSYKEEWAVDPHRVLYRYPSNFDNKAMRGVSDWQECDGQGVICIWETRWGTDSYGDKVDVPTFTDDQWFNLCEMVKLQSSLEGLVTYSQLQEILSSPDVKTQGRDNHGLLHFVPYWELKDAKGDALEYQQERLYFVDAIGDNSPGMTLGHLQVLAALKEELDS